MLFVAPIERLAAGVILILSTSLISGILCAQIQASSSDKTPTASSATSPTTPASGHSTTSAPKPAAVTSATANLHVGTPFGANLKSVAGPQTSGSSQSQSQSQSQSNSQQRSLEPSQFVGPFEVKNGFADDSLWRIPFGLEDLNEGSSTSQSLASKPSGSSGETRMHAPTYASELHDIDTDTDNDDDEREYEHEPRSAQSVQSAQIKAGSLGPPTVRAVSGFVSGPVSAPFQADLKTAAGYHYPSPHIAGHPGYGHEHAHPSHPYHGPTADYYGKYFQYASSPYPYAWEFGYRRGNPYHTIERYEHANGPHFKTKVKWSDKYGGHGVHVWDYNHDDNHYANHNYGHNHYADHSHSPGHYESSAAQQHGYHAVGAYGHH